MSSHHHGDGHQHQHDHGMMTMMTTSSPTPPSTIMPIVESIINSNNNGHHQHGSHDDESMMMTAGSMDHMGKMFFHFGYEPIVLFQQWSADSNLSMFMTCLFFFVMAIIYEILKAYRRIFSARLVSYTPNTATSINGPSVQIIHDHSHCGGDGDGDDAHHRSDLVELKSDAIESVVDNKLDSTNKNDDRPDSTSKMAKFNHPSYGMRSTTTSAMDTESGGGGSSNGSSNSCQASSVNPILTFNSANTIPLFASIQEMFSPMNIYSTFLYSLQVLFAYYLMLAFMLFNVWICLAILAGAAIGHFILAERNQTLTDHNVEDYCH